MRTANRGEMANAMKRNVAERALLAALSVIRSVEGLLIEVVSATTPWLASLIPAFMVYANSVQRLKFPEWLALSAAVVTEAIGFASINTALTFWRFNLERRKADRPAPLWVAAAAGVFYLAVVLTVNVVLDIWPDAVVLAKFLLSLLGVDGATIIAVRALHARQIAEIEGGRQERRESRHAVPAPQPMMSSNPVNKSDARPFPCLYPGCGRSFGTAQARGAHFGHRPEHKPKEAEV